jgi:hypothetical protein
MAAGLKEYGALRCTVYAARYLSSEAYRRRITRALNKGESVQVLRRDLRYVHASALRSPHLTGQSEQAWCLTLLTSAVVAWTAEYYGLVVSALRAEGRTVDEEVPAHISPVHSENVDFFGVIGVIGDVELARLDTSGFRPLRGAITDGTLTRAG